MGGAPIDVRQSDLKLWQRCPLMYRYQNIDHLPREQSGSLSFGSIIHLCVLHLEVEQDLAAAIAMFRKFWAEPSSVDAEFKVDFYVRGTNWKKYLAEGERILRHWWSLIQWESDVVLGREFGFSVPIGDGHTLNGTIDKLAIRFIPSINSRVVLVSDYKSNKKLPTYEYLAEDLQFSAYSYATTRPEFWATIPDGPEIFQRVETFPRYGEWVQLTGPKRMDAGERTQRHYNRLTMAINALAESVAMRIFVPTISGESCKWCDYRKPCGLPDLGAA